MVIFTSCPDLSLYWKSHVNFGYRVIEIESQPAPKRRLTTPCTYSVAYRSWYFNLNDNKPK